MPGFREKHERVIELLKDEVFWPVVLAVTFALLPMLVDLLN